VRLDHIGKRVGSGATVLQAVSLALETGGFHVVTGGAGAGKTTLCNIITLVEPPSEGRLRLFDSDPYGIDRGARTALRRRIGIMFQDLRLIGRLTVRENVGLPLRLGGAAATRIADDVGELLAWMGLAHCADRPAAALSGGERRLVALARAVVGRPSLLVADEPAGDLDADAIALAMRVFQQVNRLGTTVLIAADNIGFAAGIAQRRYCLHEGRLAATATEAAVP